MKEFKVGDKVKISDQFLSDIGKKALENPKGAFYNYHKLVGTVIGFHDYGHIAKGFPRVQWDKVFQPYALKVGPLHPDFIEKI